MYNISESNKWLKKANDSLEDANILHDYGKTIGPIPKIYYSSLYCAKALLLFLEKRSHKTHNGVISDFGRYIWIQ